VTHAKRTGRLRQTGFGTTLLILATISGCLPKPMSEGRGGVNITLYGFSIMKEPLEKAIYPAFADKAKREHGIDIHFTSSFAGSETVTNQILQGVKAQIAILSIERDAYRLKQAGLVTSDWHQLPQQGIVNKTPFVILVRKGNPKGIHDFSDLAKPGIKLIHPDPVSSGGAQWSILALYGSELVKSRNQTGEADRVRALQTLQAIWHNVMSTPASAREARTTFELGNGDALITYELDALMMKQGNPAADAEIVIPEATIFSEHPAVVIDRNVSVADRQVIDAFMQYLWSDEAQRAFVKYNFRAVTNETLNQENKELATIKYPFTVNDPLIGGWGRAYPEIIEGVFRDQVQKRK
jgi:sulfate transport system substrate-binding protein